jgi:predicted RNA methylase
MNAAQLELELMWNAEAVGIEATPEPPALAPATQPSAAVDRTKAPGRGTLFAFPEGLCPGSGPANLCVEKNIAALRLRKKLDRAGRQATTKEKLVLAEYVGWGGLTEVFNDQSKQATLSALKRLLGEDEFEAIRHSTLNAHFTPLPVVRFAWDCLKRIGFDGGRILEPAVGTGNFIGGMPDDLANASRIHAVELDPTSAGICRLIYPEVKLAIAGYEHTSLPDNFFDLAIGNVPFGDYRVSDRAFPKALIHDYFFIKSLSKVRPGGLIAFITSSGTMDKVNSAVRRYMAQRADLIAAVRFPETMMTRTARATVTTDLVILRRLPLGANRDETDGLEWVHTEVFPDAAVATSRLAHINRHFVSAPGSVLGELEYEGWHNRVVCREREDRPLAQLLPRAVAQMPAGAYLSLAPEERMTFVERPLAGPEDKNGAFAVDEKGRLCVVRSGSLHLISEGGANAQARIRAMMAIRDAARALLRARTDGDDRTAELHRESLNQRYDFFRLRFGFLNATGNRRLFRSDPESALLLALEHYDPDDEEATTKAALFEPMELRRLDVAKEALEPVSALAVCLNHRGRIDPDYLCQLTGLSWDRIWQAIGGDKLFFDPTTQNVLTSEEYLSGEVREKLRAARAAAEFDPHFAANVAALEAVQPTDIPPEEIRGPLGASWIDTDTIRAFVAHLLDIPVEQAPGVTHLPALGAWKLSDSSRVRGSVANTKTYGTDRYTAIELVESGLNLRLPAVYDEVEV